MKILSNLFAFVVSFVAMCGAVAGLGSATVAAAELTMGEPEAQACYGCNSDGLNCAWGCGSK